MKNLIKNLFHKKHFILPPVVGKSFDHSFHHSVNVEWSQTGRFYEALFQEKGLEKIARFDRKGKLHETRINISPTDLPENTKNLALKQGEIMNSILIKKNNEINYEVIVRENPVKRILLLLSKDTGIISKKVL